MVVCSVCVFCVAMSWTGDLSRVHPMTAGYRHQQPKVGIDNGRTDGWTISVVCGSDPFFGQLTRMKDYDSRSYLLLEIFIGVTC